MLAADFPSPGAYFGALFVNNLNGNSGEARVAFSDLNEDLWSAGIDVTYRATPSLTALRPTSPRPRW